MSLPLIYIAGKFRGPTPLDVRRNVEAARDLGFRVAQAGGYPVIPHTMTVDFDKQLTDEFWLQGTMELLKRCDAIVLTANWMQSSGARAELVMAESLNMPSWFDGHFEGDAVLQERFLKNFIESVQPRLLTWTGALAGTENG